MPVMAFGRSLVLGSGPRSRPYRTSRARGGRTPKLPGQIGPLRATSGTSKITSVVPLSAGREGTCSRLSAMPESFDLIVLGGGRAASLAIAAARAGWGAFVAPFAIVAGWHVADGTADAAVGGHDAV